MHFIVQVQTASCIQETLWSTGKSSFSEETENSKVWHEDTWSFSGVIHHAEVLCEVP